ncbi:MAG: hypothetical protein ABSF79_07400 [Smithellaceae bacterium]|jgi:hypothetical protein
MKYKYLYSIKNIINLICYCLLLSLLVSCASTSKEIIPSKTAQIAVVLGAGACSYWSFESSGIA